jgi:cytoskeletal protein CcmA (bactofilin family)
LLVHGAQTACAAGCLIEVKTEAWPVPRLEERATQRVTASVAVPLGEESTMDFNLDRRIAIRLLAAAFTFGCIVGVSTSQPAYAQSQVPVAKAAAATVNVHRNVYAAGGQVRPAGPVPGDFAAAGGRVILDQPVGGDAALVGGSVDVRAPIADDLRAAGGDISIESSVGGELFATGGNVTVTRTAAIAGAARVYGGNISIEGRVDGPLTANARSIRINGVVHGDVDLAAADIELGPLARIGGALSYDSASELKRAQGATVAGAITREEPKGQRGDRGGRTEGGSGSSWAGGVVFYLSLLACAAVLMLVAPAFAIHTSERIKATPWLALAVGLGTLLAVPVLAVLLFITLLGIPLGIMVLSLYPVLLLGGFVVGALFIARLIPPALRQSAPAAFSRNMGYVALALLLVLLVGRVPFVGGVLIGLITLAGIGACVMELYGRRKGPPSAGVPSGRPEALPPAGAEMPDASGRA